MDRVLIIDGLNYIYHSNHVGAKQLGEYGIVFCFFRSLRKLVEKFAPSKIFFCKEGSNNFRYGLYKDYKANRLIKLASKTKEETDSFNRQRDIIFDLIKYLPITQVYNNDHEADDIIFSLCDNLKDEECIIVSNDSDLQQLLQKSYKNIKIYNPFKKIYVEAPKYFVLIFKSLAGDKSDNIPSIVGKKKAEILANDPDKLKLFFEQNEEARIQFNDNLELIRLRLIQPNDLVFIDHQVNYMMLKNEFQNMKFDSIIRSDVWPKFVDTFSSINL